LDFLEKWLDFGLFLADCCTDYLVKWLQDKMNETTRQLSILPTAFKLAGDFVEKNVAP